MKEYTRTVTGVVHTWNRFCNVDSRSLEELLVDVVGKERTFAGTIRIVVTDLTADSGAPAANAGATGEAGEEAGR